MLTNRKTRTLHYDEVRVVDVELHALEEILHALTRRIASVDEELVLAAHHNLTRYGDFVVLLVTAIKDLPIN